MPRFCDQTHAHLLLSWRWGTPAPSLEFGLQNEGQGLRACRSGLVAEAESDPR